MAELIIGVLLLLFFTLVVLFYQCSLFSKKGKKGVIKSEAGGT
jgi:hypothetical protein